MGLDKLKEMLGDNEEAAPILGEVEKTITDLTGKINFLENESKKAFTTRDEVKGKLKTIQEKLGLEELTDEALEKVLKGKGTDDAEINNLKALIEKSNKEKEDIESGYKSKLSQYALKTELQKTGLAQKALDETAYSVLEGLALQGATYENDAIIFKNDDGSTKYVNGKPMGLSDKVQELYNTQSFAGLFKPDGKNGTGSNPQGGKGGNAGTKKRSEMTHSEKAAYISEHGQDAYLKLP